MTADSTSQGRQTSGQGTVIPFNVRNTRVYNKTAHGTRPKGNAGILQRARVSTAHLRQSDKNIVMDDSEF